MCLRNEARLRKTWDQRLGSGRGGIAEMPGYLPGNELEVTRHLVLGATFRRGIPQGPHLSHKLLHPWLRTKAPGRGGAWVPRGRALLDHSQSVAMNPGAGGDKPRLLFPSGQEGDPNPTQGQAQRGPQGFPPRGWLSTTQDSPVFPLGAREAWLALPHSHPRSTLLRSHDLSSKCEHVLRSTHKTIFGSGSLGGSVG